MTQAVNPLEDIRARIKAGDRSWALARLRSLIRKGAVAPDVHRLLAFAHLEDGDFAAAVGALGDARAIQTTPATEVAFGRFLNKEGHKQAALNCILAAVELDQENADALALACMLHGELGQIELGIPYGQRSLEARDKQSRAHVIAPAGTARPHAFDPASPNRNIISFSVFGDNPYYWESAVAIASMALAIFPEWRCRFYCDPKLPESVRRCLLRLRAQLFVSPRESANWSGLFWRFRAFDDPKVDVVMVRDVDSPFTLRERLAVDEWLASPYPFHVIRDHYYHCEPMMGGLWGGWTRLLPSMQRLVQNYLDRAKNRYADQEFLRLNIWPRIRGATLTHDRYFTFGETRRPPRHPTEATTHIGMGWPRRARSSKMETPSETGRARPGTIADSKAR